MKVTQIRRVGPAAGSTNLGGSGGIIDGGGENFGGGFPPSGQVPVATGSNTWAWASNVQLITADGSNKILSPFVNIASGSNIILTMDVGPFPGQAFPSNTVRIHSTASGGGGGTTITTKDEGSTLSTTVTTLDFVGAGVTASGAGATTTITIPGGGSSSDPTIPSGGTLYDGTSTSGFTSHNSPDTFNADSTIAGHFYVQETTMGGGNTVGAYHAVGGSFPRTYTMKLSDSYFHANFHNPQLWVAEASPGKIVGWGPVHDGATAYLQRQLWTNATTISTQTNFPGAQDAWMVPPLWLRLVVNSSTDIEGWQSFNGYIYYRHFSAYNPGFTVGSFGFGISAFAGTEMKMAVDWIHET